MARIGRLFAFVALASSLALAAGYQASAQLSTDRVQAGETFPLIVQAQTEGDAKEIPDPQVQLPAGITKGGVHKSQGSSTSIQIINFQMTKKVFTTVTWQIDLRAVKTGTWTVGPVTLGGKNLGQGQVTVTAGRPDPVTGKISHDVTAATLVGKRSAYVGQQIPFTWRLEATRPFQVKKFPDVRSILGNGFWSAAPDTQPRLQVVGLGNGGRKGRLDIPGSLFPLRAGSFRLPVTSLNYQIVEQEAVDPFQALMAGLDPFAAGRTRVIDGTASTQAVPLQVRALPEKGRPASFQGGVGTFTLKAHLEKDTVRAGEGVNLVLSLEGDGQPQGSGNPVWEAPKGVEAYPPEDKWSQAWKSGRLWASLERRIVLVPDQAGTLKLPSARFGYFDPVAGEYRELTVEVPALRVLPALHKADAAKGASSGQELSGRDRFWIIFGKVSAVLWGLLLCAGLAWAIFVLVRRYASPAARRRRALVRLRHELSKIPRGGDSRLRARLLRSLLTEFLVWEVGEHSRGLTLQETLEALPAWSEELREGLSGFWKDLDAAEFAGVEPPDPAFLATLLSRD